MGESVTLIIRFLRCLRNLANKRAIELELDEEIRAYVDSVAGERMAAGMSASEARRTALAEFGGVEQVKQAVREQRTGVGLDLVWQDVHYGLRQLRRSPLFTATALVTLALGMGATTAIFSAIDSLLLRPLSYAHAGRLVAVWAGKQDGGAGDTFTPDFMAMRSSMHTLDQIAGYRSGMVSANVTDIAVPTRVVKAEITANLLQTLGVRPQIGRGFSAEEDVAGGPAVVLISDRLREQLRRNAFAGGPTGDAGILGKAITVNGEKKTVIGVLPRGFEFPDPTEEPDVFVAAAFPVTTAFAGGPVAGVTTIASLREGVTLEQAQAEMEGFQKQRESAYPDGWGQGAFHMEMLQRHLTGDNRRPLLLLLGCVLAVLLITCANVANLQLARGAARGHETAVRGALGATEGRLVRQFLIENLLLASGAALLELAVVWVSFSLLHGWGLDQLSGKYAHEIQLDGRVMWFSVALALVTTLLFGLAPAMQAARWGRREKSFAGLGTARATPGRERRNLRYALLIMEVAAAIGLLSTAGLLMRSFQNVLGNETGFDARHTLTCEIGVEDGRYQSAMAERTFANEALPRLKALPGVEAAAIANALPLMNTGKMQFSLDGDQNPPFDMGHLVTILTVTPEYFRAVGTRVLQGRTFGEADSSTAPRVLIVNRTLAARFFGGKALGQRLYVRNAEGTKPKFVAATIVGVAEDVPHDGLLRPIEPEIYLPLAQSPNWWGLQVVLRTIGAPGALASDMGKVIASVNRDLPIFDIETMEDRVASAVAQRHAILVLTGCFALVAVVLSAGGICGVFAYVVSQRTQEMGIRLALGATRGNLVQLVALEAATLINVGGLVGLGLAVASSRAIASMLVGVGQHDPLALVGAWGLTTVLALAASLIPAASAARTDVLSVLRDE
jgi:putative ABC transport system permease protein